MALGSTFSLLLGCLLVVGCGASQQSVIVDTSDPMWTPPGQVDLAVADSPEAPPPKPAPRARALKQPNHAAIPADPNRARRGRP